MTHEFMYPKVDAVDDTAPETPTGGPARSPGTHNDSVGDASTRGHEEPASGPPVGRDGPLRSASERREVAPPPPPTT
jgi:hypothetical protein